MGTFIRSHPGPFVSVGVSLVYALLMVLRALYLQKKRKTAPANPSGEMRFRYPLVQRWLMGFAGVFFLGMAVVSGLYTEGQSIAIPVIFVAFGLLGAVAWYYLTAVVVVDEQGIAFKRLGREVRVAYGEITRVEAERLEQGVVIHAGKKRIGVEGFLEEYSTFLKTVEFYHRKALARGASRRR